VAEYGLKYADFDVLQATLPTVRRAVPVAMVRKNAQCGRRRMANARILGTTPEYREIKHLAVRRGRFLTPTDVATTATWRSWRGCRRASVLVRGSARPAAAAG